MSYKSLSIDPTGKFAVLEEKTKQKDQYKLKKTMAISTGLVGRISFN